MKKSKGLVLISLLGLLAFTLSGCISVGNNKKKAQQNTAGGLYKTVNNGKEWKQASVIPTASGQPSNFAALNVSSLVVDPGDPKAIYFGSEGSGLLYSYDSGETWQIAKSLGQGSVGAVAIDPKNKCVIYASIGNKLFKTEDCSRNWETVYHDTQLTAVIIDVMVDHFNSEVIYIGLNRREGDVIKSSNGGLSWQTVHRTSKGKLKKVLMDPNDSRKLYAATEKDGVYRTANNGSSWQPVSSIDAKLKEFSLGREFRDLVITKGEEPAIFLAMKSGMMRSDDGGIEWEKIDLIPPEKDASINAIAASSTKPNLIYYTTNTTFYHSEDGGENWATYKLPTIRAGWKILLDPMIDGVVYLGVKGEVR
jgi:photosystem II stability/assembly factor-like uncharacterized protein